MVKSETKQLDWSVSCLSDAPGFTPLVSEVSYYAGMLNRSHRIWEVSMFPASSNTGMKDSENNIIHTSLRTIH